MGLRAPHTAEPPASEDQQGVGLLAVTHAHVLTRTRTHSPRTCTHTGAQGAARSGPGPRVAFVAPSPR